MCICLYIYIYIYDLSGHLHELDLAGHAGLVQDYMQCYLV